MVKQNLFFKLTNLCLRAKSLRMRKEEFFFPEKQAFERRKKKVDYIFYLNQSVSFTKNAFCLWNSWQKNENNSTLRKKISLSLGEYIFGVWFFHQVQILYFLLVFLLFFKIGCKYAAKLIDLAQMICQSACRVN